MKKINLESVIADLKSKMNDYSVDFCQDYMQPFSTSYFCDAVSEFADGRTSIYYSDIAKYMSENIEHVNDTISEFGWEGCGSDLYKAGQLAEYTDIQNQLYSDEDNIILLAAADFLLDTEGNTVPEDLWESVSDGLCVPDRIDDLYEAIVSAVSEWKEENEETVFESVVSVVADAVPVAGADATAVAEV